MYRIISFLLISLAIGCKGAKQEAKHITALQELKNFPIVEVSIREIIHLPKESNLLSLEASVKAGIDFTEIDTTSIHIDDDKIRLTLPKPKMISFEVDPQSLELEYHSGTRSRLPLTPDQRKNIMAAAEKQLNDKIDSLQLIRVAEEKTTAFLASYFQSIGYTKISIRFNHINTHD